MKQLISVSSLLMAAGVTTSMALFVMGSEIRWFVLGGPVHTTPTMLGAGALGRRSQGSWRRTPRAALIVGPTLARVRGIVALTDPTQMAIAPPLLGAGTAEPREPSLAGQREGDKSVRGA